MTAETFERGGWKFSEAAQAEAAEIAGRLGALVAERPLVRGLTIDGPASLDLDDALWLESLPAGGYRLDISIADVASCVMPQLTPNLDREVLERAFTRYHPGRTTPMLPAVLGEDQLSLREGQVRPAVTISLPFDTNHVPGEPTIRRTRLISASRLTYAQADEMIAAGNHPLASMLQSIYQLAQHLFQLRRARGALAVYDPRQGWATNEEGLLIRLTREQCHHSYLLVQECMILANQVCAHYLARLGIPALYRNHGARAIAPSSEVLRQSLETALLRPDHVNPERISATIHLALERAVYAPTLSGHFGLQLPAYLHITSPLRRYADLVNQRILLAVLAGEPAVHGREDLESIAAHVNAVERNLKEERPAYFLATYERQLRQQVEEALRVGADSPRPLGHLDARHFHSLLRMSAQSQTLHPAVEAEILARLGEAALQPHDLFTLLFRFATQGPNWERVKRAALRYLQREPQHAMSVLAMGQQTLGWEAPTCHTILQVVSQNRRFEAQASVKVDGRLYTSGLHCAARKERARQQACAELLVLISGLDLEVDPAEKVESRPAALPRSAEPDDADQEDSIGQSLRSSSLALTSVDNYKGALQELAQAHHWALPRYTECRRNGPPHAPLFTVECQLVAEGVSYTAHGEGGTRGRAEQEAARNMLHLLPFSVQQQLRAAAEHEALRILNEMVQRGELRDVVYTHEAAGPAHAPLFSCVCTVTLPSGHMVRRSAQGTTRKGATRAAAIEVLRSLLTPVDEQGSELR
jgi:ribonuclease R